MRNKENAFGSETYAKVKNRPKLAVHAEIRFAAGRTDAHALQPAHAVTWITTGQRAFMHQN